MKRLLHIHTWSQEESDEIKKIQTRTRCVKVVLILVLVVLTFFIFRSCAIASGLGNNEAEFQSIKQEVQQKIQGTGATLSEVVVPKLSKQDIANIKLARKQLGEIK